MVYPVIVEIREYLWFSLSWLPACFWRWLVWFIWFSIFSSFFESRAPITVKYLRPYNLSWHQSTPRKIKECQWPSVIIIIRIRSRLIRITHHLLWWSLSIRHKYQRCRLKDITWTTWCRINMPRSRDIWPTIDFNGRNSVNTKENGRSIFLVGSTIETIEHCFDSIFIGQADKSTYFFAIFDSQD